MALLDKKKMQILDAAIAEFQEHGFSGASMDRISERAGVSKRTVYTRFDSKETLFRAMIHSLADRINEALVISYVPGAPIDEQLLGAAWAEGALLTDPHFMALARLIMSETIRNPEFAAEMEGRMTKAKAFADFFAAAQTDGALVCPDPKLAAGEFLGLIKAQAFYPRLFSGVPVSRDEMTAIAKGAVAMILKSYGPQPEAT